MIKIVSGGQTGVDRAALDVALQLNLPHGGWCPLGRRAEDGLIPSIYLLRETSSSDYAERTEWNVRDADATLVLYWSRPMGGTMLTIAVAKRLKKPLFLIDLDHPPDCHQVSAKLLSCSVSVLNVAGPRESLRPGVIYSQARSYLYHLFSLFTEDRSAPTPDEVA